MYNLTKNIIKIEYKDWIILYHSLLGMPVLMNKLGLEVFETDQASSLQTDITNRQWEKINKIKKEYFKVEEQIIRDKFAMDADKYVNKLGQDASVSSLSLYITIACNFNCTYCIHFSSLAKIESDEKKLFMSFKMAKNAIDKYMDSIKKAGLKDANIEIIGGEPLLNWNILEKILDYTYDTYQDQFKLNFGIVSNLTLLNKDIIEKFKKYNIPIFTSIDGSKNYHDKARVYSNGKPTYDDIMESINLAEKNDHCITGFNFTMCDENWNAMSKEFIYKAKQRGFSSIHGDFNFLGVNNKNKEMIVDKLMEILDVTFKNKLQMNGTFSSPFVNLMNGHYHDGLRIFCSKLKGNNFSVMPNGTLLVCNYIPIPIGKLDQLDNVFDSNKYKSLIKTFMPGQKKYCENCVIEGFCNGGCPSGGAIRGEDELINKDMCHIYQKTFERMLHFVIDIFEQGEESIRQFFYRSKNLDRIIAVLNEKKDENKIIIEPIGGVKLNLCSGGLSFDDTNEEYRYWYDNMHCD